VRDRLAGCCCSRYLGGRAGWLGLDAAATAADMNEMRVKHVTYDVTPSLGML
jgi:hypothetical protein